MDVEQEKLSHREEEILLLAAEGLTDKEIAGHLGVQISTVRTYWDRLKNKLHAANRTEAVARSLKLIRATNSYKSFAEAFPHLVVVTNSLGEIEFANSRWHTYFGIDGQRQIDWAKLVHPEDLPEFRTMWQRSKESAEGKYRLRYRRNDGEYRWHLAAQAPLEVHDGSVTKWIGTAIDVEDVKLHDGRERAESES